MDIDPLDERLRRLVADAVGTVPEPPDLAAEIAATSTSRTGRRVGLLVTLSVAAAMVVAALIVTRQLSADESGDVRTADTTEATTEVSADTSLAGSGQSTSSTGTETQPSGSPVWEAGWNEVPGSTLGGRTESLGVWTGSEVLILGGRPDPTCPPNARCVAPSTTSFSDGAAFQPATGRWRPLTAAPVPLVAPAATAVMTDDQSLYVLVRGVGEGPDYQSAFLRYDIANDGWDVLTAPTGAGYQIAAAAGGVVAYLGSDEQATQPDLKFDPDTNSWDAIPDDPLGPSFDRMMVGVGNSLYLFAKDLVPNPGSERPALVRAAEFDLASGQWDRRTDSEIIGSGPPIVVDNVIYFPNQGSADGGQVNNWGRAYPLGGEYHPDTDTWSPLPDPASTMSTPIAGILGTDTSAYLAASGAILSTAQNSWTDIGSPPGVPDTSFGQVVVAAGRDLFVYGGEYWTGEKGSTVTITALWTPPAEGHDTVP